MRHLSTEYSLHHKLCGRTDCSIINGQELVIPNKLNELIKNKKVKVYSSPLKRCLETLWILQDGIEIKDYEIVDDFIERDWGMFSGYNKDQIRELYKCDISDLKRVKDVESDEVLYKRVQSGLKTIAKQQNDVNIIITHQGCINAILDYYKIEKRKIRTGEFIIIQDMSLN